MKELGQYKLTAPHRKFPKITLFYYGLLQHFRRRQRKRDWGTENHPPEL